MKPRILFLTLSKFEDLARKGVVGMFLERDEGGFFEKVISIHPFTEETKVIPLSENQVLYELGFDRGFYEKKSRLLRYLLFPVHFLRILNRMILLIKRQEIDLIRATDPYMGGLIAMLAARFTKIPFCISIHADNDKRYELAGSNVAPTIMRSRKLAKYLERFVLSRAHLVMPIRESLGRWAVLNGADIKKIRLIPHGIDLSYFKKPGNCNIREKLNLNELAIISFVGRLSKDNYVDDIVALARQLSKKREDFVIIMAGGGNEEERLRQLVGGDMVLKRTMRLLGFQPRKICLELRRVSTVSLCLMGGFSLIEACAAGNPVISYDVEWHYELVKNKITGFLISEGDISALCDAIEYIIDHPLEARRLGENARNLAFSQHDIKNSSAIKRRAYLELLEGREYHAR